MAGPIVGAMRPQTYVYGVTPNDVYVAFRALVRSLTTDEAEDALADLAAVAWSELNQRAGGSANSGAAPLQAQRLLLRAAVRIVDRLSDRIILAETSGK